ncbi:hypothetical protein BC828DRAFT_396100 [Blastocladiella britannica]|nr:hypothetical protein BC828DRAFT_396100 [Blastocladiella britannica]
MASAARRRRARGGTAATPIVAHADTDPAIRSRGTTRRKGNDESAPPPVIPVARAARRLIESKALTFAALPADELAALKGCVRYSDADLATAIDALLAALRRGTSSHPRLTALLVLDYLFTRSAAARARIVPHLLAIAHHTILPPGASATTLGTRRLDAMFPGPVAVAHELRRTAMDRVYRWHVRFSDEDPRIASVIERLVSPVCGIDFGPVRDAVDAERQVGVDAERDRRARRNRALVRMSEMLPSVTRLVASMDALLGIAAPSVDELLAEFAGGSNSSPLLLSLTGATTYSATDQTQQRHSFAAPSVSAQAAWNAAALGLGSHTATVVVNLSPSHVAAEIPPAVRAELDREYLLAVAQYRPEMRSLLAVLGESASSEGVVEGEKEQLLRTWLEKLDAVIARAERAGCSVVSGVREEADSDPTENEQVADDFGEVDDDFEEVEDEDSFEETVLDDEDNSADRLLELELFGPPG